MSGLETDLGTWAMALTANAITFVVVALVVLVARWFGRKRPGVPATIERAHRPLQVVAQVSVVRITIPPLLGDWRGPAAQLATACLAAATAWLVGAIVLRIEDLTLSRYRLDVADNLEARRVHTQISIVRRITVAVIAVIGAGALLTTIPQARAAGASVLASAGVVGLVAALAAQSTLGNIFAGLHLAFGNSLRLDDIVVVEGEWGRIEEITLSYVVVKIWDERRLILPSSYFTTTPFQNWTRSSAEVIGTIDLDVDWTVPIDELREAGRRVVEGSELWDGRAYGLQITEAMGGLVRARLLISAADSSAQWDLRCLVREELVTWLRREHPSALPRQRTDVRGTLNGVAAQPVPAPRG